MILFPLIFFAGITFVFSGSSNGVSNQQFMLNCPLPLQNQIAVLGSPPILGGNKLPSSSVGGTYINYTLLTPNTVIQNRTGTGTYFYCNLQTPPGGITAPSVILVATNYGGTAFANFPSGWFQWVGDSLGALLTKIQIFILLIVAYVTAPAQVTGIAWFNYISAFLLTLIATGLVMVIRS